MAGRRGFGERLARGAQNAMELVRFGRLTERTGSPFEVRQQGTHHRLRHYKGRKLGRVVDAPILLVPPLMVTSDVYDIAEDVSAVRNLLAAGVDVWVCDFGAPEKEEGGMARTLDDHIRAVDACIEAVREHTGQDVHLGGYSQGGMFCYQVAALRRSRGLKSVITFGSPVDIHRNLPNVGDSAAAQLARIAQMAVEKPLQELDGLPGIFSSTGFKLLSFRKEVEQVADFFAKLHDRQALERREGRRRFLGGEGFVAWPGPALRTFIDEFIVHNRMLSGGFVIDGRTVTLADVTCPVLFFVGSRDDFARPASVRAVRRAVPPGEVYEVTLQAGHFGLVVGSKALSITWPVVADWMRWQEGKGTKPPTLREEDPLVDAEDGAFAGYDFDVRLFVDAARDVAKSMWGAFNDLVEDAGDYAKNVRWQLPRLAELERLTDDSPVSFAKSLAEQAADHPDRTFFLWRGRAFTYGQADARVDAVVRGLWHAGVRPGDRVALCMQQRPSYLSAVAALSRLGATTALIRETASVEEARRACALAEATALVTDPEHATAFSALLEGEDDATLARIMVLGGGPDRTLTEVEEGPTVIDLEKIDPVGVSLPETFEANAARGGDLALVFFSPSRREPGGLRASRVTGRRWAFSALGAAAACSLTPDDTVYAPLPLHHIGGLVVSAGSALVGGARLALADSADSGFPHLGQDADAFWTEVRRYGATVVFYAGEAARTLTSAPFSSRDADNPVRLFAGSGMRKGTWRALTARFGVSVVEFYAATEVNVILANTLGETVGSVGTMLPGSAGVALAAFDVNTGTLLRDGRFVRGAAEGAPGVLLAKVPVEEAGGARFAHDVFERGDAYFVSGDVLRADESGEYHFVGRLGEMVATDVGPRSVREIEDGLDLHEDVLLSVARVVVAEDGSPSVEVRVALREGAAWEEEALRALLSELPVALSSARLRRVPIEEIRLSEGFRPIKV